MAQLASVFVHHLEIHEKVRAQHVGFDVRPHDVQRCRFTHQLQYRVHQAACAKALVAQGCGHACSGVGQRHQTRAGPLVQGLEQGLNFFFQHARHQPFAAFLAHLVEDKQRHRHGHTVQRIAWRMQVTGLAIHAAHAQGFGKHGGGNARRLVAHQLVAGKQQQLGLLFHLFAVPAFAAKSTAHIGRQLLVVKSVNQLLVHQHVLAAGLVFELLHLFDELAIGRQKWQRTLPLTRHQRLTDEHLARTGQVHPTVVDPPPAVDHDAIERGALQGDDFGRFFLPMRVQQLFLEQMPAHLFQPLRVNIGNAAAEQARGLHQLRGHDPTPRLFGQVRARMRKKLDATRPQVFALLAFVLDLAAHIAQQPCQHGQMQLLVRRRRGVQPPLVLGHHGVQLAVNIFPLAQPAHVDKVLAQQLLVLAVAELVCRGNGGRTPISRSETRALPPIAPPVW